MSNQGKFKSQRGDTKDTVWCEKEVPWPHNYIIAGTNKNRTSYDSLSMSQWVSGFSTIIHEETNIETKNSMLEYLSDLMDDSHDFGLPSAKGAQAVLLCKVNWGRPQRLIVSGEFKHKGLKPVILLGNQIQMTNQPHVGTFRKVLLVKR